MPLIRTITIFCLTLFILGCETKPETVTFLDKDYQREEADWLSFDEAKLRKATISNLEYHLRIDLTKSERYSGSVELRFDYLPTKFPLTIDFVQGEAERILVNNTPIAIDYNGNFINIPSKHLNKGLNSIKIQYSHAYSDNGSGLYRYVDAADDRVYIYSHFEPYDANKLFPSFDQPNLRSTYELKVVAPKQWTVVTSNRESTVDEDGPYKRWTFPKSPNFSTYIFPLHAGPWHIWEGKAKKTPLRLMTRQSLSKKIDVLHWFKITQQGFKFYEEYFNMPYPYSKYDQLLVPDFNIGAMENVGAVTYTESFIPIGKPTNSQNRRVANTILHELSHMWFGDLVTIDWWSALWLKESFASYMAPLALSEATEYKDAWRAFYSRTKQNAYQADQRVTTHPIDMPVTDTKSGDASFDSITYSKGASVLQQLAHYIGKDDFRDGIRNYLSDQENQAATLDDFFDALKKSSSKDLNSWAAVWLNQAGVNSILANYQCDAGKITEFELIQSAPTDHPYLRTHRLQLGLYHKNEQLDIVPYKLLPVTINASETKVPELVGEKCPQFVYPNHSDWGYIKVELDDKTLLMLPESINSFKEPLLRSMFWQSLWDMVLDLKMPLDQYLQLVLKNISYEADDEILIQLLETLYKSNQLISAKGNTAVNITNLLVQLESLLLQESQISQDGSDRQNIWFSYYIDLAKSNKALNHLSNFLQGNAEPKEMNKDQELRWKIIVQLSASAHPAAEDLLNIEKQLDSSDNGTMMALAAQASKPDLQVKEYWLDELRRTEERQSAARLKQASSYLFPASQGELQKLFAERIIKDIHYLDRHRGQVLVEHLVEMILPTLCSVDSVSLLSEAEQNMDKLGLIAQKGIRIARQEDQRCIDINALIQRKDK